MECEGALSPVIRENLKDLQTTSQLSLRTIEHLPVDYHDDFFSHYSRLKLGVTESVEYYGPQLSRLAKDAITDSLPQQVDWAITAPPYHVLPGGPNLLASYLYEDLKRTFRDSINLSLVHLPVETEHLEIKDWESLNKFHNYSTFSAQERNQLYDGSRLLSLNASDFQSRSILFVNDIKVTGTQQEYMERTFVKVNPRQICWLYILVIDPEIAKVEPEVEYAINNSSNASLEEFGALLATQNLQYTSRCITRLLSYEVSELAILFQMLDAGRKRAILELALAEGRFSGDYFREKIDLLRRSIG